MHDWTDQHAGPAPGLVRTLSVPGAIFITLSALSPGIGVFVVGAGLLHQVGSASVLCFGAALIVGVAMAQVYAELGSAFPEAGGEYTILRGVLGDGAGYATLALLLPAYAVSLAFNCRGAAEYVREVLPGLPAVPAAMAMVVAATLVSVLNLRLNARITLVFLLVEAGSLMLVAGLGVAYWHRAPWPMLLHPLAAGGQGLAPVRLPALAMAMAGGIYAFNGYGAVIYFSEELIGGGRRIARVMFAVLGLAALLQMPPMLGVLAGAGDLPATLRDAAPIAAFVQHAGGVWLGRLLGCAVAAAIFNAMIAMVLGGGRQVYATARDGVWPAVVNRKLGRIDARQRSPVWATLAIGLPGVALCLAPPPLLLMLLAGGNVYVYGALCWAAMVGRRTGSTRGTHARMRFFPAAPVFGLAAAVVIAGATALDPAVGRPGLLIDAGLAASGLAYGALRGRRLRSNND